MAFVLTGSAQSSQSLLAMLNEGTHNWRSELGHISDAAVAWQPFARGHNISAMLLHLADEESYVMEELVLGHPRSEAYLELFGTDLSTVHRGEWPKPMAESLEWHYAILDAIRGHTDLALSETDPARRIVHPRWGEIPISSAVLRLIQHEAYHAGQMMLHKIHYGWGGQEPMAA